MEEKKMNEMQDGAEQNDTAAGGEQQPHKRRVRYKGTHPRHFSEKYKEHNPEKYADTIEKVIKKGSTPAGMHISIMVNEILDFFDIQPGQKGLDCTLGYGGHTLEMLKKLNHTGHMVGLDVDQIDQEELCGMLIENSDEPYAEEISKTVVRWRRKGKKIDTTTKLYQVIEEALSMIPEKERKEAVKKSCQRTFQALRIDINNEFEVLYQLMDKLPGVLTPGGKVAILTFHSGEDRLVKKTFMQFYQMGEYKEISKDVIRPSAEECARNSRAKSTKMRWAVKV